MIDQILHLMGRAYDALGPMYYASVYVLLCLLSVANYLTRDYRKRVQVWQATEGLPKEALYQHFAQAMWIAGAYLAKPFRPVVTAQAATGALLVATVLRERIEDGSGRRAALRYLASRRELARVARAWYRSESGGNRVTGNPQ